jgi:ABC-type branched-subunit amino acid transport system substrate-binding protein
MPGAGTARRNARRVPVPVLSAILAALWLAGCQPLPAPSPGGCGVGATPPVVALILPEDAGTAASDPPGVDLADAARLARRDLGTVAVDLQVLPAASGIAAATARAVDAGAVLIIGPPSPPAAAAVFDTATPRGVPVLSLGHGPVGVGDNVWMLGQAPDAAARRLAGFAASAGLTRIAILHPVGTEGEAAAGAAKEALASEGLRPVAVGSHPVPGAGLTNARLAGLAADLSAARTEAVVLAAGPDEGLAEVAAGLRQNGLRQVRFIGLQRWDADPDVLAVPALQGGWFAGPDAALAVQFGRRFRAAYGRNPHPQAGLAYDGVAVAGALLAGVPPTPAAWARALSAARLAQPDGFAGVYGVFRFLPDGRNERALAVYEARGGTARLVDPAPRRFGGPGSGRS